MYLEALQSVFREVFEDENLVITAHTSAQDIDMWDSLTHMFLVASVEERFKIKFSFSEVVKFEKVEDMLKAIESKVN